MYQTTEWLVLRTEEEIDNLNLDKPCYMNSEKMKVKLPPLTDLINKLKQDLATNGEARIATCVQIDE